LSNPLVSIVICCHNRCDYLQQTLDSVFAQTYSPVEIIVMDDGSTDGTPELMASYADRIRYTWQECQGIAAARTNASRIARGEFIAYQDDDDLMPADRITNLYNALCEYPTAVFATGDYAVIDKAGKLTGSRWMPGTLEDKGRPVLIEDGQLAVLWPKVPAVPHTTLFRRRLGEQIGWFDLDFKYACSDADFLARLGQLGPIVYLREIVSYYRRGHSAIWSDDVRTSCSRIQLWGKHLALIGPHKPELRRRLQERLRGTLVTLAAHRRRSKLSDPHVDGWLQKGRSMLGAKEQLMYHLGTSINTPVRDFVKKAIRG
jgi:glycosyltransferase involved in cell wall biosynthesis